MLSLLPHGESRMPAQMGNVLTGRVREVLHDSGINRARSVADHAVLEGALQGMKEIAHGKAWALHGKLGQWRFVWPVIGLLGRLGRPRPEVSQFLLPPEGQPGGRGVGDGVEGLEGTEYAHILVQNMVKTRQTQSEVS